LCWKPAQFEVRMSRLFVNKVIVYYTFLKTTLKTVE